MKRATRSGALRTRIDFAKRARQWEAPSIPRQLAALKARVGKRELKYIDIDISGQINSTPNYSIWINPVVQGVDFNQRIGSQIQVKGIRLKFYVYVVNTDVPAQGFEVFSMALIRDTRPQLSTPEWFSATASQSVMGQNSTEALPNKTTSALRYKILKYFRGMIANNKVGTSGFNQNMPGAIGFDFYTKVPQKLSTARYATALAGTYATDADDGQFSLVGQSTAGANLIFVVGFSRVTYYDD